ncbi:hypothetical protein GCM10025771_15300 [Niveibacterium umoris]|uniref:Tetratricopeptide (TPR) repeat protein/SAM-dependent methyltransferase n=1 Tax=Niveibacterium umoris TaxID=1193620 RepID=A0A840BMW2_9RHOO|nr:methyltransferase domain-containing protein [Niveibacterium umoris]MBB4014595.1 tetratricopeptide (TPR) repeat protein/SAM-dependent methyltransferase [Niveibacterium umoris]
MDEAEILEQLNAALQAYAGEDFVRAEKLCRAVLVEAPARPEALTLLGILSRRAGNVAEAQRLYRQAIAAAPHYADAHHNLGNLLMDQGEQQAALACFLAAAEARPNWAEGCNRVAATLHALGRLDEAETWFQRALALRPDSADIHWDHALALLAAGRYAEGWREYEWRWRRGQPAPREFRQPAWQGEALAGRTVLVYSEQGYGDAIQFLRFLPALKALGARVVLEVHAPLSALVGAHLGVDLLVTSGSPLPEFDCHVPLLSLPLYLGIGADALQGDAAYLVPPPEHVSRWAERLRSDALRVGLVWAGNPNVKNDRWRSPRLGPMLPVLQVPGVAFYGLQKGDGERDAEALSQANFTALGPEINDFADTAAIIAALDLVITTDTSVAHLAGALGKPAWVLLHASPDWRWGHAGERSAWYASLRLYRQPALGDWQTPISAIVRDLQALVSGRGHVGGPLLTEPVSVCPLCAGKSLRDVGVWDCRAHALWHPPLPPTIGWRTCASCGHVFASARYTADGLTELFRRAHPGQLGGGDFDAQRFTWSRVVERVLAQHPRAGSVFSGALSWLDVGCGAGGLVFTAAEFGFEATGLDVREEAAKRLRDLGYRAVCADLERFVPERRFSVVSLADVLEHVPFPRDALRKVRALLEDDGLLFVSCPNMDCAAWRGMDAAGANPYWHELEHLHNFSRRSLAAILDAEGFDLVSYGVSQRYKACMEIIARRRPDVGGSA